MPISQKNRPVQIATPLGEDVLLFYRMSGRERLGGLFEYELELLSEHGSIDPDRLLGENVTVGVSLPEGGWRFFNGYVARFGQQEPLDGFAVYRATLRPWLWFLTRAANCRIFQNANAPDIVKQVFRDQGFAGFTERLSGEYAAREYCVQYRETDFDFASRLMEEEGIYYYFTHENGRHTLVLADSPSAHEPFPGYATIPYHPETGGTDKTRAGHIHAWAVGREVQPGAHALADYDFKKPKADLRVKSAIAMPHAHAGYERFDYPGRYAELGHGENLARRRMEQRRAEFEGCTGHGNARGLAAGHRFKLTGHRREAQNRDCLVVSADYQIRLDGYIATASPASGGDLFQCAFAAIDAAQAYRPPRLTPKSAVHGPQTAVVVGPAGEEIYTDEYGRVKVQFHWDRYGKQDENSSCWIRVAQPWAGQRWGMVALPRIGQEVVVEFLEGDPDRPLVTGSVYNHGQMPPYALPANKTQSGIKSRSSKGGLPPHFNEIRFEDKKGEEQVYIHAEKNQDNVVENDETTRVGRDRSETVGRNETVAIGGFHTETVALAKAETVGLGKALTVGLGYAVTAGKDILVTAGDSIHLTVGKSSLVMKSDGTIIINGKTVDAVGTDHIQLDSKRIDVN
jgi:type VI secretion system secreted protein VgrG